MHLAETRNYMLDPIILGFFVIWRWRLFSRRVEVLSKGQPEIWPTIVRLFKIYVLFDCSSKNLANNEPYRLMLVEQG
jgi:hypothetical protein